jgi:phosphatidate cytidylyltransferase
MTDAARSQFLLVLAAVVGVLVLASIVSRVLQARAGGGERSLVLSNLEARIRAWWVMVALFAVAVLAGPAALAGLFAVVSLVAVREFASHAPADAADPALDAACYALVVFQYLVVALGARALVTGALPVVAMIALPLAAIATGGTRALQSRIALRLWWFMLGGWCLSHVPALLLLDIPDFAGRNVLLVVWLVIVAQGSDVLQYVFGKLHGRRPIAPVLSPDKTVEGFVGGAATATAIGAALGWMTPFGAWHACLASALVAALGFLGGLLLSGIKRDLAIKDWGRAIHGHGGVLDRVDSLCLSAPALFYLVRVLG